MESKEYIEYMEEDDKKSIKLETDREYFEEDTTIKTEISKNNEFFEEDVKTENKDPMKIKIQCVLYTRISEQK